jgi:hypothetical protein
MPIHGRQQWPCLPGLFLRATVSRVLGVSADLHLVLALPRQNDARSIETAALIPTRSPRVTCHGRAGRQVPITRVSGLERHVVALADLDDRLDVRVPAVVARPGLLRERLPSVDRDRLRHGGHSITPSAR